MTLKNRAVRYPCNPLILGAAETQIIRPAGNGCAPANDDAKDFGIKSA